MIVLNEQFETHVIFKAEPPQSDLGEFRTRVGGLTSNRKEGRIRSLIHSESSESGPMDRQTLTNELESKSVGDSADVIKFNNIERKFSNIVSHGA